MGKCKETAGVLYPHPCTREATLTCASCQKAICSLHARDSRSGPAICIACFKKVPDPHRDAVSDPFLMAAAYYPDYDTGSVARSRLRQATGSEGGAEVGDFETDFDGT